MPQTNTNLQKYQNKNDTFADLFIDEQICAETLRAIRWPTGKVICLYCDSEDVKLYEMRGMINRYKCKRCKKTFNDKTQTIFAGSKLPLKKWFYAITLIRNKSSADNLVAELLVDQKTADRMMTLIQGSVFLKRDIPKFTSTTESDEVYITAGCKGNGLGRPPDRLPRKRGLKKRGARHGMMTGRQYSA